MSKARNYELELYRLLVCPDMYDKSFSFVKYMNCGKDKFIVCVDYRCLHDFLVGISEILGNSVYSNFRNKTQKSIGEINKEGLLINLLDLISHSKIDIDLENLFPQYYKEPRRTGGKQL